MFALMIWTLVAGGISVSFFPAGFRDKDACEAQFSMIVETTKTENMFLVHPLYHNCVPVVPGDHRF